MFIICPKCSAKYKIPDGVDLAPGQKLKCSACGFIFEKGQEAPLVLDATVRDDTPVSGDTPVQAPTPAPETSTSEAPIPPAFSNPLFTQPIETTAPVLPTLTADSVPVAFQPVDTPPRKSHVGLILIYLILLIALCVVGWSCRTLFKPTLTDLFPAESSRRVAQTPVQPTPPRAVLTQPTPAPAQKAEPATPAPTPAVVPVKQPTPVPHPTPAVQPIPAQPTPAVRPSRPVQPSQPTHTEALPPEHPIPAPSQPIRTLPEHPKIPTDNTPDTPTESVDDQVPLFDMVVDPLAAATPADLALANLTFRTVLDDNGLPQLLIEGSLRNDGTDRRSLPFITVVVSDKAGTPLTQKKVHITADSIAPGEVVSFFTGITPAPAGVDHVDVHF